MFCALLLVALASACLTVMLMKGGGASLFALSASDLAGAGFLVVMFGLGWTFALSLSLPLWAVVSRFGMARWFVALPTGFLLAFIVTFGLGTAGFDGETSAGFSSGDNVGPLWIAGKITERGLRSALNLSLVFGATGACQALAIHVIAHLLAARRPPP